MEWRRVKVLNINNMVFGGFVKQSLIDYPGKIAAVLFTRGCNFRCGYCHNPGLVLPHLFPKTENYSKETIVQWLTGRKNWLDAVVVTGGEPTIHSGLPTFLKQLRSMGFSIKLDTNGTNPAMLESLLRHNLIDYIAMDIKNIPDVHGYRQVVGIDLPDAMMKRINESIYLLGNAGIKVEFRTTILPEIHTSAVLSEIEALLPKKALYTTQLYRDTETVGDWT